MSDCTENKNPLQHNGTSQLERLLPGMKKDFVRVDEKNFADWIVFTNEFAAYINYYDQKNGISGDWKPFFSNDIASLLGILAIQDVNSYKTAIKERLDFIRNDDNKNSLVLLKIKLNELFSAILTLSKAMDEYLLRLPDKITLRISLQNLIHTKLAPALQDLIAYFKGAAAHSLTDNSSLSDWKIFNKSVTDAANLINVVGLSSNWFDPLTYANWTAYKNSISTDDSIFNDPNSNFGDIYISIEHAANHNLFTGILDSFLTGYAGIIGDAEKELLGILDKYDSHQPHFALFLAFLKLFRFAQSDINTVTRRHLDFYYKEVLQLKPKLALPNKVHLLGELAKQTDQYLLPVGTPLNGGKDSIKKDVIYSLDSDTVLNKGKVARLMSFYKASESDNIIILGTNSLKQYNKGRVFASPVSNSEDGMGAALQSVNMEWQPFVHKLYKESSLDKISMPPAELGFAIASHYLFLNEGERNVFLRFVLSNNGALNNKNIICWLTTEKEWYKVPAIKISSAKKTLNDNKTPCAEISFTIPGSGPAIVNYNPMVHGGTYNCSLPMLKIMLVQNDTSAYEYDALMNINLSKLEIKVDVGFEEKGYNRLGVKNLQLSNDMGVLDSSKPFLPFGGLPRKDTGLVIGNKELFCKKNSSLKLNIEWADLPNAASTIKYETNLLSTTTPAAIPQFLEGGIWKSHQQEASIAASVELFTGVNPTQQLFSSGQPVPAGSIGNYTEQYTAQTGSSTHGFIRLNLGSSFGHSDYIKDLSVFYIEKNPAITTKTIIVPPVEPLTPKIKSIYLSYTASTLIDLTNTSSYTNREIMFFHIYPFGEGEQHKYLEPGAELFLLPQFQHTHQDDAIAKPHVGEWYIGLENLSPGGAVNILFQVMEGSTNPRVIKPPLHLHWFYLGNNHWTEFKDNEFSDNTLQLVQSGIISFAIPQKAGLVNSILPKGYLWLKAAVTEAPEAVCKMISVDAQAGVATFINEDNASDFLDKALPAGTVTKLKNPDASIKKLNQPYPSFGGRPNENEEHFYIRVSERLRHKSRAITVWDYEHLILEAFPEVYKVKCLNHTRIEPGKYNEVKPGNISIITIPLLQNRNDADPLKPFTQQSILSRIEIFLQNKVSCFVQVHAAQPQFEEMRMEFSLCLYDQFKDFNFYANQLKEEITQFLSPWAFGDYHSIDFGGKVYKSVLINFIEDRYYVDFITEVKIYVKTDESSKESADQEEITASTARSILVSAPASLHAIMPIKKNVGSAAENCPPVI